MERENPLESFCLNTTCHAIGPMYKSKSAYSRCLWFVVLCLALIGTCFVLWGIIVDFFESPTATSITVDTQNEMIIPDLLICNQHSFNLTFLRERNISEEFALYIQHILMWSVGDYEKKYPIELEPEFELRYEELLTRYPNGDIREFFFEAGVPCEQFLLECELLSNQTFDCCEHFQVVFDKMYGSCFLYDKNPIQSYAGFGLHLLIQPFYENYMPGFDSDSAGLSVSIQHEYDPMKYTEALVAPGQHADISLDAEIVEVRNTFLKKVCSELQTERSLSKCWYECGHRLFLRDFNCSYPTDYRYFGISTNFTFFPICSPKLAAVDSIADEESRRCASNCMKTCSEHNIKNSVTVGKRWKRNGSDDKVSMEIYFGNFEITRIREVDTFTALSVVSNVGGAMGIFLGASLVTIIEVVMFIVAQVGTAMRKKSRHQTGSTTK